MPRNVEIKAKLKNINHVLKIVADLCQSDGTLLNQEDVFFDVSRGRLKLRSFQDRKTSQLISYTRPDTRGPKVSNYSICEIENSKDLLQVLSSSLGIKGLVKKKRHLFLLGQTRIHVDSVENLGEFLELEVVLDDKQDFADGEKTAKELLKKLEISEEDLITGAYIDLQ